MLLGFVDVVLELREVPVDAQVGVSVVHGDIIKNSDCNSEFHAKFISLLLFEPTRNVERVKTPR